MAESITKAAGFVPCPFCPVPLAEPTSLVVLVDYPADTAEIAALAVGSLNAVVHVCGNVVRFDGPLAVVDRQRSRTVGTLGSGDPARDADVELVGSVDAVRQAMLGWIFGDTARLWTSITDGTFLDLDRRERIERTTPLDLLAIKLARDGALDIVVDAPPDRVADAERMAKELGLALTTMQIFDVVDQSAEDRTLVDVFGILAERVPTACFDDAVLAAVAERTDDALQDDGAHPMALYRRLLACAASHALAGTPNPFDQDLADLLLVLDDLARRPDVEMDDQVWLRPDVLRALVSTNAALTAAGRRAPIAQLDDTTIEFLRRLGQDAAVEDVATTRRIVVDGDRLPRGAVAEMVASTASQLLEDDGDAEGAWWFGAVIGRVVCHLAAALVDTDAIATFDEADVEVRRHGLTAWASFRSAVIETMNREHRTRLAVWAVQGVEVLRDELAPRHAIHVFNEVGNTFRYVHHHEAALGCYAAAAAINDRDVDDPAVAVVLRRNVAIVHREMGLLGRAQAELLELLAAQPDDWGVTDSLVALYVETGRIVAAESLLEGILARRRLAPSDELRARIRRGTTRALLADDAGAVGDLRWALDVLPEEPPTVERYAVQALTQWIEASDPETRAFLDDVADDMLAAADAMAERSSNRTVQFLAPALIRKLVDGDVAWVRRSLATLAELCDRYEHRAPWHLGLAVASVRLADGELDEARADLTSALRAFDDHVPSGDEAVWALSSIGRRDLVMAQSVATELALALHDGAPDTLVATYDLGNGRELLSTAGRRATVPALDDAVAHLAATQHRLGADVVTIVDGPDGCHLLVLPLDGAPALVPFADVHDIAAAVRGLRAMNLANPIAPAAVDRLTAPWWQLAATFAVLVRQRLPELRPLVVLPGGRLTAVPFHAAGWPDAEPLIAERSVAQAVNHRLLAATRAARDDDRLTVLACPKAGDSPEFGAQLAATAAAIVDTEGLGPGEVVLGTEVTEARLVEAMATSRELAVLCHGLRSAGDEEGPALCVAADGLLPPSTMPLGEDRALHAFAVSWLDLADVERTPETVVSVACSSGLTGVGIGGTRLGLDQALTANATRHLVRPIWNVDQSTALAWLEAFYDARPDRSTASVLAGHRSATLAVRATSPHPYHWAPFALDLAFQGAPP